MGFRDQFAPQQPEFVHVRFGSKADIKACPRDVRFTPKSGHRLSLSGCPLCAKSGLTQCNKKDRYSMTSSARTSRDDGTVRPRALAVLRLTINSNVTGCSKGKSSGFVPRKILST